jgi:hypothetical protein
VKVSAIQRRRVMLFSLSLHEIGLDRGTQERGRLNSVPFLVALVMLACCCLPILPGGFKQIAVQNNLLQWMKV